MNRYGATNPTGYSSGTGPTKGRPCAIASLPMAVVLVALFFMPWLTVSCDGQEAMASAPPDVRMSAAALARQTGLPPGRLTGKMAFACATGWELAAGKLSPAEELAKLPGAMPPETDGKVPKGRAWVYMGLVLPGLLVLICAAAAVGTAEPAKAGKWMMLLALTGLVFALVATSVDYVDDIIDNARDDAGAGMAHNRAADRYLSQAETQLKKVIKTEATVHLWASLGLYGLIAACGLAALSAGGPGVAISRPTSLREPAEGHFHANRRAGDVPGFGPDIYQPPAAGPAWREGVTPTDPAIRPPNAG